MELITDAHFWVGVALVVFIGVLVFAGIHKFAWKALGDAGAKVQAQLDQAAPPPPPTPPLRRLRGPGRAPQPK